MKEIKNIITITIITMLIAICFPIGLGLVGNMGNVGIYEAPFPYHYRGTYSFFIEDEGDNPIGFDVYEGGSSEIQVKNEIDEHSNVVELYAISGQNCYINRSDFSEESGTIEFWFRTSNVNTYTFIFLTEGTLDSGGVELRISQNKFYYTDLTMTYTLLDPATANKWYRYKIDFECGSGGYQGLSADRYNVYLYDSNGITLLASATSSRFEASDSNLDNVTEIMMGMQPVPASANFYSWFDAIGFSWDSNYNLGDNLDFETHPIYLNEIVDPVVLTVLVVILPLFAVIGVITLFLPKLRK